MGVVATGREAWSLGHCVTPESPSPRSSSSSSCRSTIRTSIASDDHSQVNVGQDNANEEDVECSHVDQMMNNGASEVGSRAVGDTVTAAVPPKNVAKDDNRSARTFPGQLKRQSQARDVRSPPAGTCASDCSTAMTTSVDSLQDDSRIEAALQLLADRIQCRVDMPPFSPADGEQTDQRQQDYDHQVHHCMIQRTRYDRCITTFATAATTLPQPSSEVCWPPVDMEQFRGAYVEARDNHFITNPWETCLELDSEGIPCKWRSMRIRTKQYSSRNDDGAREDWNWAQAFTLHYRRLPRWQHIDFDEIGLAPEEIASGVISRRWTRGEPQESLVAKIRVKVRSLSLNSLQARFHIHRPHWRSLSDQECASRQAQSETCYDSVASRRSSSP